jgi:hypothetical protein
MPIVSGVPDLPATLVFRIELAGVLMPGPANLVG